MSDRASVYGQVKAAIFAGLELGLSVNETAERFGLGKRSVRSCMGSMGVKLRPLRRRHGSLKEAVVAGHEGGQSCREIKDATGFSSHAIYAAARRLGVTLKPIKVSSLRCTKAPQIQEQGKARSATIQATHRE
jgi:transposase